MVLSNKGRKNYNKWKIKYKCKGNNIRIEFRYKMGRKLRGWRRRYRLWRLLSVKNRNKIGILLINLINRRKLISN